MEIQKADMTLTDQERTQDMLLMEKHLGTAYFMAEQECANQDLRKALHNLHEQVETLHHRVFHAMHERNWYQTPVAGQQAIEGELIKWEQKQVRRPELST
ncbi:MAG TPA: spore coat protein [Symbiobacteriaceae bacterium]